MNADTENAPDSSGPEGRHNKSNHKSKAEAARSRSLSEARHEAKSLAGGKDNVSLTKPQIPTATKVQTVSKPSNLLDERAIKKAEEDEDLRRRQQELRMQNMATGFSKVNLLGENAPISMSISARD